MTRQYGRAGAPPAGGLPHGVTSQGAGRLLALSSARNSAFYLSCVFLFVCFLVFFPAGHKRVGIWKEKPSLSPFSGSLPDPAPLSSSSMEPVPFAIAKALSLKSASWEFQSWLSGNEPN